MSKLKPFDMDEPSVILETTTFLVLNKPVGWVVNEARTAHGNNTVQEWVKRNVDSDISMSDEMRNGIVHRLDKDTSGAILVAKDKHSFTALQLQFKERIVRKTYLTLVHGELKGGGVITAPIMRNPKNRTKFTVLPGGRAAETEYKVVRLIKRNNEIYSLLEVSPKTGRTHQIRVHFAHIHHPVVADPLYVGRKTLRRDVVWCSRLFLHAWKLDFKDPVRGNEVSVEAPLARDLKLVVSSEK